ncbi:carbamoyl-phosphate synthase arginine-specific large chain [Verticillium alfalfae VaMs.102]|uniref:carbamoyl-phosphate synthase (glutamine-hydrolyzing) n=1 Tax=Verticillium alfalfae (strain VaMs.102 / ATCC MYA-4576 / FGSC 10136) TaxID=526221 RepID=C9SHV7_VERA1|nr:carbamoyl-phosphate synthase arginine-specific large chain [Verticillium alfalfae VaMs.102]EEY18530.1 carbamoyl-phosphate synthase arginine-specific large chain [Verticillium alfalfae VaMs.102]
MKSVGEVMAIGRTLRSPSRRPSARSTPSSPASRATTLRTSTSSSRTPPTRRWLAVGQAMLHHDYSVDKVHDLTKIDKWFLYKLENIVNMTRELQDAGGLSALTKDQVLQAKKLGFSDRQIGNAVKSTEDEVRAVRKNFGIRPWVKKIDTLAAEFPADTNYLYTTYNASSHDVTFEDKGTIILGSGVYRIGSSVEFDWCAVSATNAVRELGQKAVMINVSPKVSFLCFLSSLVHFFDLPSMQLFCPVILLLRGFSSILSRSSHIT